MRGGGLPGLFDERAVVIGRAEIDVDASHLVAVEDEELGIPECFAILGDTTIGDEGFIAFVAPWPPRRLADPFCPQAAAGPA